MHEPWQAPDPSPHALAEVKNLQRRLQQARDAQERAEHAERDLSRQLEQAHFKLAAMRSGCTCGAADRFLE